MTDGDDDGAARAGFRLEPTDGVLKVIAKRAPPREPQGGGRRPQLKGRRVFKIDLGMPAGAQAELRQECLDGGYILGENSDGIDWSDAKFEGLDAIGARYRDIHPDHRRQSAAIMGPIIRSYMRDNDIVVASGGPREVVAVGVVFGPYAYDASRADTFRNKRPIQWLWRGEEGCPRSPSTPTFSRRSGSSSLPTAR